MTPDLFVDPVPARSKPTVILPPAAAESLYDQRDGDQLCRVCGLWGAFGFDVALLKGKSGRFACLAHRAQVEGMAS